MNTQQCSDGQEMSSNDCMSDCVMSFNFLWPSSLPPLTVLAITYFTRGRLLSVLLPFFTVFFPIPHQTCCSRTFFALPAITIFRSRAVIKLRQWTNSLARGAFFCCNCFKHDCLPLINGCVRVGTGTIPYRLVYYSHRRGIVKAKAAKPLYLMPIFGERRGLLS